VVDRSLRTATERAVDRGKNLVRAAAAVLQRSIGEDITVQEVAEEAGQSLRTLYQYFESKDDLLLAVFEESMLTYAVFIERAISGLEDPLDRLAGAMLASVRIAELGRPGVDRALSRLRLRLADSQPELIGRAQAAVTALLRDLVDAAGAARRIAVDDPDGATFVVMALNASYITTSTIGNDAGVDRPDLAAMVAFCLRAMGAELEDGWFARIDGRLELPRSGG
jgi:AcrR family transcriptional regulator